jgi:large subunit ribosomal protein L10
VNKEQKRQCIESVRKDMDGQSLVVVATQRGVSVATSTQLRRALREECAKVRIVKNTLLRIAFAESKLTGLIQFLSGPTVLVYSSEPVSAAKILMKFISENPEKIQVVGCWLNGSILFAESVSELAKLPSMNELRAKIISIIMSPATKVASILNEVVVRVSRVIAAKNDKF